jgi:hypothetical protein
MKISIRDILKKLKILEIAIGETLEILKKYCENFNEENFEKMLKVSILDILKEIVKIRKSRKTRQNFPSIKTEANAPLQFRSTMSAENFPSSPYTIF